MDERWARIEADANSPPREDGKDGAGELSPPASGCTLSKIEQIEEPLEEQCY